MSNNTTGKATGNGGYNISPVIINDILTLSAITNESFNYNINIEGSTPINIEIYKPSNYNGTLKLYSNIINGECYQPGLYNISIKVINKYGFDVKNLVLNIHEPIKITNTNLEIYSKINSKFSYVINSSGLSSKNYYISALPGIYLDGNIIKGIFTSVGIYTITLTVSNGVETDIKNLIINVGTSPIITSESTKYSQINENFNYQIESTGSDIKYKVIGVLPKGLVFKETLIYGVPTEICKKEVELKAINAYGESTKILTITIYK